MTDPISTLASDVVAENFVTVATLSLEVVDVAAAAVALVVELPLAGQQLAVGRLLVAELPVAAAAAELAVDGQQLQQPFAAVKPP